MKIKKEICEGHVQVWEQQNVPHNVKLKFHGGDLTSQKC